MGGERGSALSVEFVVDGRAVVDHFAEGGHVVPLVSEQGAYSASEHLGLPHDFVGHARDHALEACEGAKLLARVVVAEMSAEEGLHCGEGAAYVRVGFHQQLVIREEDL